ncbi:MAG: HAMP domain-containing sensor histidine kinase [Acidimicrobiia bacterium]
MLSADVSHMGTEVEARSQSRNRTVVVAVGASLLLVLFVASLAFSNSIGAAKVAGNAASLHWANATLGTSSLARAAMVQAVTFAGLEGEGLVADEDLQFAMDQVEVSYNELKNLEAQGGSSQSAAFLTHFLAPLSESMELLDNGSVADAQMTLLGDTETAYLNLVESLKTEQAAIQAAIADNTAAAARVNGYVVFILTLAIPGVAVAIYWWTARRQVKEYRLKSELELEAERAVGRAKDSFIAGLSHELRTPLTSIYGFAEILTDGGTEDREQTTEIAQIIANEAAEMTRMVDDLLTASRLESTGIEIEKVPTRVQDIVESAITPFERAGLTIKREPTNELIETDGARLRHVLVNLLSNAARHGGPQIGVEVSAGNDTVDIEIWDNGQGVPEEQIEKLFERFIHAGGQTLLTGSVGLGLAIASRLTNMLGGRLSYQRFAGKTYFTVNVPAMSIDMTEHQDEAESVADRIRAMTQ